MGTVIIVVAGVALLAWLIWYAASGKLSSGGGSGGSFLTGFHDFQPRDKQEAIEIVMEQNDGKRWEEQESGEGDDEGKEEKDLKRATEVKQQGEKESETIDESE